MQWQIFQPGQCGFCEEAKTEEEKEEEEQKSRDN
jgi:hypothetical protein